MANIQLANPHNNVNVSIERCWGSGEKYRLEYEGTRDDLVAAGCCAPETLALWAKGKTRRDPYGRRCIVQYRKRFIRYRCWMQIDEALQMPGITRALILEADMEQRRDIQERDLRVRTTADEVSGRSSPTAQEFLCAYEQLDERAKSYILSICGLLSHAVTHGDELTLHLFERTGHLPVEQRYKLLVARTRDRSDSHFEVIKGTSRLELPWDRVSLSYSIDGPGSVRFWYNGPADQLVGSGAAEDFMVLAATRGRRRVDSHGDYFSRHVLPNGRLHLFRSITSAERARMLPGAPVDRISGQKRAVSPEELRYRRGSMGLAWVNPSKEVRHG